MFKVSVKFRAEQSQGERKSRGLAELVILGLSWCALAIRWFFTLTVATGCLYQVVASPPLHLMGFTVKPAAGESSIYVPGACSRSLLLWFQAYGLMIPLAFVPSEYHFILILSQAPAFLVSGFI
jgi:hypothetical protein